MRKETLYEKLGREAERGATLMELKAEIDQQGPLLTGVEREEAWLYAWALIRRRERYVVLAPDWDSEQGHGYVGDAGAG